jgi:hypothetical protein
MTAAAIISDLLIVLVQGTGTAYHWSLLAIGCILNAAAIVLAVYFVVSLVDPDRIPKAARRLLAEEAAPTGDASLGEFVEVFIPLERQVRELAVAADLAVGRGPERFESFSRLVQLLLSRERLDRDLAASLLELGRYRNLVVHGHVQSVDRTMVQRAKAALGMMQALADSRRKAEAAQQGVEADEAR